MSSISIIGRKAQLTLDFEPTLADHYPTLRDYVKHRVEKQAKPAKTIAGDMDLSPSILSRKLAPGDGDTQRFNTDDLENYIRVTGDTAPIEYLISKYLQPVGSRERRLAQRVDELVAEVGELAKALRSAA